MGAGGFRFAAFSCRALPEFQSANWRTCHVEDVTYENHTHVFFLSGTEGAPSSSGPHAESGLVTLKGFQLSPKNPGSTFFVCPRLTWGAKGLKYDLPGRVARPGSVFSEEK